MMRHWTRGSLALLLIFTLLQGGIATALSTPAAVGPDHAPTMSATSLEMQPGTVASQKAAESGLNRAPHLPKRDGRAGGGGAGGGDDQAAALLLLVAAAVLVLPALVRVIAWTMDAGAGPVRIAPMATGRCPTGPPAFA